ncbi:acyl-CoA dehydrogenase family protein [Streptomyces sp. NPDC048430]|uniref:acyl-CoA dehydrogenase family protein n=1 Tax=Streptomyces sp. NPDC048430 TaxID=3155388 RepID=UPI00342FB377
MAEFVFTPEQQDLRAAVRKFCADTVPEDIVRTLMDSPTGHSAEVWARLGGELGVLGLAVPEALGGAGGGYVDQAAVFEEFGAALVPGPVFGTVALAIPALLALGGDELLADLVEGTRSAGFAVPDRTGRFDAALITVTASGGAVTGAVAQVVDGGADVLLVAARDGDTIGLYATGGGSRTPLSTLDQTRRQAAVRFDATPARLLASGADAERAITHALHVGGALLAAEQVGGAQRLIDATVAYAKTRLQFGRPIGSFQAVKHTCADMFVRVEHARSVAYHAAWALQEGTDDADLAVSIAQATCSEAFRSVAMDTVQMHGGIGFTWEHPTHLYLKRAVTDSVLLGSAAAHREHIAAAVLDQAQANGVLAVAAG